jgi:hypothetical protein
MTSTSLGRTRCNDSPRTFAGNRSMKPANLSNLALTETLKNIGIRYDAIFQTGRDLRLSF